MTMLSVENVTRSFGGLRAVAGVSLAVGKGEILGLFGPNGAGKTTLFNLIAGALLPDGGRVMFLEQDVTRLPAHRRARLGIGRTHQIVKPFRALTTLTNLMVPLAHESLRGLLPLGLYDTRRRRERGMELLGRVGLAEKADAPAGSLPLGMQKRLEVARALALDPALLLLDEPLAGLTQREAESLLATVGELSTTLGIILVEHNLRLAMPVCDRAVVMDAGEVIASGAPEAVRRDENVIRAYMGDEDDA